MNRVGSFLGDWWRLVVPYFKSEERWIAISLLIAAVVLTLSGVAVNVAYNEWSRRFFDTFQNKDEPGFWLEMINFSWIAGLTIAFSIARGLASPYLRLRWRRWLTRQYLGHWLDSRGYYRIELERKIGQQALEIDFLKGCLQRIEEQRMLQAVTGNPRSTRRSKKK